MPSNLTIQESSNEPMLTEHGGDIEKLDINRAAEIPDRVIKDADATKELPAVQGGKIKRINRSSSKDRRWFDDSRDNPLHVRQWVYESLLGAVVLVFLFSFLVIVTSSARQGKLDLRSFLEQSALFLGGLGIGFVARHKAKRRKPRGDDEERQNGGDDTS